MRRSLIVGTLFILLLALGAPQAFATGWGFSLETSGGGGTLDPDGIVGDFDVDYSGLDVAFVMDTNLAEDTLFNYRLNVGFSGFDIENTNGDAFLEYAGLTVDNTFGFGVFRSKSFRLWLGPQLRAGFYAGETSGPSSVDAALVSFGLAPVIGFNWNSPSRVTLSLSAGYRVSGFVGAIDNVNSTDDFTADGGLAFLNFAVVFRGSADSY